MWGAASFFAGGGAGPAKPASQLSSAGAQWLLCIPIQVGPATQYARNVTHWMHFILLLQLGVCVMRFVLLGDFLGGFWMGLVASLGWYAWYHEMNITYICCWGVLCLVNGVFDVLSLVLPMLLSVFSFSIIKLGVQISIPVAYGLGALFSWHLYRDYVHSHKAGASLPEFDPLGKYVDSYDPEGFMPGAARQGSGERLGSGTGGPAWMPSVFKHPKSPEVKREVPSPTLAESAQAASYGAVQQAAAAGSGLFAAGADFLEETLVGARTAGAGPGSGVGPTMQEARAGGPPQRREPTECC